jgi:hypothetical protein
MITTKQAKAIFSLYDVELTDIEAIETAEQCNENGAKAHRDLNASQWCHRWARSESACMTADGAEAAKQTYWDN